MSSDVFVLEEGVLTERPGSRERLEFKGRGGDFYPKAEEAGLPMLVCFGGRGRLPVTGPCQTQMVSVEMGLTSQCQRVILLRSLFCLRVFFQTLCLPEGSHQNDGGTFPKSNKASTFGEE